MGSINLNGLKATQEDTDNSLFTDLHLDLVETRASTDIGTPAPQGKDIRVDKDMAAVINSVTNILNTSPGERFLVPEFGINLKKFLFQPVSEAVANSIGAAIITGLERWEPRLTVDHIKVLGNPFGSVVKRFKSGIDARINSEEPGDNEYIVTLVISVPLFKRQITIDGFLNNDGFVKADEI